MEFIHRLIVIDSVFSQPKGQPFDCIRDNEVNHQTLPHGEIAIYLDHLREQGVIQIADQSGEYTRYTTAETVVSNLTAVFDSPIQTQNLSTL
jgi:hypothetical protein